MTATIDSVGTKVRVKMPDGKTHTFTEWMKAVHFLNKTKTAADTSKMPSFFAQYIKQQNINQ